MATIVQKLQIKFKMADFLLDLGYGSQEALCLSGHDTCPYQITLMYDNFEGGASNLKFSRGCP